MTFSKTVALPSTILNKPNGAHTVTIARFNYGHQLVEFTDGSTCYLSDNRIAYSLFWSKFFTREEIEAGIADEQIEALKGATLTAHVADSVFKGKPFRFVRFERGVSQ